MSLNNWKISENIITDILEYSRKDKRDNLLINGIIIILTLK